MDAELTFCGQENTWRDCCAIESDAEIRLGAWVRSWWCLGRDCRGCEQQRRDYRRDAHGDMCMCL